MRVRSLHRNRVENEKSQLKILSGLRLCRSVVRWEAVAVTTHAPIPLKHYRKSLLPSQAFLWLLAQTKIA